MDKPDRSWMPLAACRGYDPDLFYPVDNTAPTVALECCARCPVRFPCLEYSLATREYLGIWGGLGQRERMRILRHRRAA